MIESAHFHNFKSLRDVELTGLQRLTVLVGPSGVGKTSVLQGLNLWAQAQQMLSDTREGQEETRRILKRLVTDGSEDLRIDFRRERQKLTVRVDQGVVIVSKPGPDDTTAEKIAKDPSELERWMEEDAGELERHLRQSILFKFDPEHLGASSLAARSPRLASNGDGLATLLAYLAGADRDAIEAIEGELRAITQITGRIRTLPDEIWVTERENIRIDEQVVQRTTRRQAAAHRFEVEVVGFGSIPGDLLSEGTLVSLGVLTVLHQPNGPSLILFDDVDRGLHPDAQAKLLAILRKFLALREDLQIICTTHSPYLLDHIAPEEVQVMSFDEGQVVAARLDQHEDWPNWKGKLQTGEFWQSAGESWVKASKRDVG